MILLELLKMFYLVISKFFVALLNPIFIIPIAIVIVSRLIRIYEYRKSTYSKITKASYTAVTSDTGIYGEYLIYKHLKKYESSGAKFLFNLYIPKADGETTEIDALMICSKGIFVFESKNYSGWIFGGETQKYWYQTLPRGRGKSQKETFYNPIMQNRGHIQYLKAIVGEQVVMRSVIAFSDRCTLQNIQINSEDVKVINRSNVEVVVANVYKQVHEELLTEYDILKIYNELYPYTQVDEIIKQRHVDNIKKRRNKNVSNKEVFVAETTKQTAQNLLKCPKCNCSLVLRTSTKGENAGKQFYGCANYPNCKYILKL